jgi:alanine-glyoxylate transaminase / serine-glyoxylate transaminase / serine-pyruvate transaminase
VIAEEGIENRWERHRRCHRAFVKGVEAMGLRMHVPEAHRIATLNTVCVPQGVDEAKLANACWTNPASKSLAVSGRSRAKSSASE